MGRNLTETLMGAVVLVVAAFFVHFAYQSSNIQTNDQYRLVAKFDRVDGIAIGNDIRIGGIKVGVVQGMELDQETYLAVVTLGVKQGVKVPSDSIAAIVSESLLGQKYIAIEPGGSEEMLQDGAAISLTQSSVNLETLIGKLMFGGDDDKGDSQSTADDDLELSL